MFAVFFILPLAVCMILFNVALNVVYLLVML